MTSFPDHEVVVVRLLERAALPADLVASYPHARPFSDDVVEMLFVDAEGAGRLLEDDEVQELGGPKVASELALRNLARRVPDLEVHHLGNEDVGVTLLTSDSVVTASTVLLLPQVLAHAELGAAPDGVFVATPTRSELLVHPLRDARSTPSLQVLAQMARSGFEQGVGRLSPHVHWWDGASFTQLTRIGDTSIRLEIGEDLRRVLDRIAD